MAETVCIFLNIFSSIIVKIIRKASKYMLSGAKNQLEWFVKMPGRCVLFIEGKRSVPSSIVLQIAEKLTKKL